MEAEASTTSEPASAGLPLTQLSNTVPNIPLANNTAISSVYTMTSVPSMTYSPVLPDIPAQCAMFPLATSSAAPGTYTPQHPFNQLKKRSAPLEDITLQEQAKRQFSASPKKFNTALGNNREAVTLSDSRNCLNESLYSITDRKIDKEELDRLIYSIPLRDAREADPFSETALVLHFLQQY